MREIRTRKLKSFAEGTMWSVVHDLEKRERERRSWGEKEEKGKENWAEKEAEREAGKEKEETDASDAFKFDFLIFIYVLQIHLQKYPFFFVVS